MDRASRFLIGTVEGSNPSAFTKTTRLSGFFVYINLRIKEIVTLVRASRFLIGTVEGSNPSAFTKTNRLSGFFV